MNLIVDDNIACAEEAFSPLGAVTLLPADEIGKKRLLTADALLVRSTTRVDRALLEGTPVRFVGTATTGTDHVDLAYLREAGIEFSDAAGCNARAVAEWVMASLVRAVNPRTPAGIAENSQIETAFARLSIGIVGVGRIGTLVAEMAGALGLRVLLNDPPRKRRGGAEGFVELDEALQADVVTFHVPLTRAGGDATYHLLDSTRMDRLPKDVVLINTSRGAVIDNAALRAWLAVRPSALVVLDVWENEPEIDIELLKLVSQASPHVAGYSLEAKLRATEMLHGALARFLGKKPSWSAGPPNDAADQDSKGDPVSEMLGAAALALPGLEKDDRSMRELLRFPASVRGRYFESLRRGYALRREFGWQSAG